MSARRRLVPAERSDERRSVERKIQFAEQDLTQAADGLSLEDLRRESESVGADELKAELDRLAAASRDVVDQIASLSNEFAALMFACYAAVIVAGIVSSRLESI